MLVLFRSETIIDEVWDSGVFSQSVCDSYGLSVNIRGVGQWYSNSWYSEVLDWDTWEYRLSGILFAPCLLFYAKIGGLGGL